MRNDWATAKEAGLECSHAWLHLTARGERNPKSEIRNPKSEKNSKFEPERSETSLAQPF